MSASAEAGVVPDDAFEQLHLHFQVHPNTRRLAPVFKAVLESLAAKNVLNTEEVTQLRHYARFPSTEPPIGALLELLEIKGKEKTYPVFMEALEVSGYPRMDVLRQKKVSPPKTQQDDKQSTFGALVGRLLGSKQKSPMPTGLFDLCRNGGPACDVERLLKQEGTKVILNTTDPDGRNVLHHACYGGNKDTVKLLVKRVPAGKLQEQDEKGASPFFVACDKGHAHLLDILAKAGAAASSASRGGRTPLHAACQAGHVDVVHWLLRSSKAAGTDSMDVRGYTPIHIAIQTGNKELATVLIQHGASVNLPTAKGNTALHIASHEGHEELAALLVKQGANVNAANDQGETPLHYASQRGHQNLVRMLLKHGAWVDAPASTSVSVTSDEGNTPLHLASLRGYYELAADLLEYGAGVNAATSQGNTPLHLASEKHHHKLVALLLEHGADVNAKNCRGNTPHVETSVGQEGKSKVSDGSHSFAVKEIDKRLHIICLHGDVEEALQLIQHGADVNGRTYQGDTPLHFACLKGHLQFVEMLVQHNALVGHANCQGNVPLHIASLEGYDSVVTFLLKCGAAVDATNKREETPLHLACQRGHCAVAQQLLQHGASVMASTKEGDTALLLASQLDHQQLALQLLKHEVDVKVANRRGQTALHCASQRGHHRLTELLLERGACVNVTTDEGETPLRLACQNGNKDVARLLLQHGANANLMTRLDCFTPLHVASQSNDTDLAQLLLEHSASSNAKTSQGFTPLHFAIKNANKELSKLLLKHHASVHATTLEGYTPLHFSIQRGNQEICQLLVKGGADVNAGTSWGTTPLDLACIADRASLARLLIQYGAHVNATANEGYTPLLLSCEKGREEIATLLIKHGASVNAKTSKGYTPLHFASQKGMHRVAAQLLRRGANVDAVDNNFETPLSSATSDEVAELLIRFGADVVSVSGAHVFSGTFYYESSERKKALFDVARKQGNSELHIAIIKNDSKVVLQILLKGANVNARNIFDNTPLHIAVFKNSHEICKLLLDHGASVNASNSSGNTPLHIAIFRWKSEIAELLVQRGADVNARNKEGGTPLHVAHPKQEAELLIQHGADVNMADNDGMTPLHSATRGNHKAMAELLIQRGANVNVADSKGNTPLHIASARENLETARLLVRSGADVNATDNEGNTSLHVASHWQHELGYFFQCLKTAELLVQRGADVNMKKLEGNTSLHVNAGKGREDMAALLIQHGAKVNMTNAEGNTPLNLAGQCFLGTDVMVRTLVEAGADPSITNRRGNTWLHEACLHGQKNTIKKLSEHGKHSLITTCLDIANDEGDTPLHIASSQGHGDIVRQFLDQGATTGVTNKAGKTPLELAMANHHKGIVDLLTDANVKRHDRELPKLTLADSCAAKEALQKPTIPNTSSQLLFSENVQYCKEFSSNGGELQGDSDVVLLVPEGAVDESEIVSIGRAVSVDLQTVHKTLKMSEAEMIVSPVVEYCTDRIGSRFNKNLQIYLPHFLPEHFSKDDVSVYIFHKNNDGSLCVEHLTRLESQDFSDTKQAAAKSETKDKDIVRDFEAKTLEAYFAFSGSRGILVFTPHFTGVVCTYCSKLPPQLHLRLYGAHLQRKTRHVDIFLLIGDKRLEIRDFRQGSLSEEEDNAIVTKNLGPVDDVVGKAVGARLVFPEDCWIHRDKRVENCFPSEQRVDLEDIRPCCEESLPGRIDWELEHRADRDPDLWFGCYIEAGYILCEDTTFTFFKRPVNQTLSVKGLRLQNEQRSAKTQTDEEQSATHVKRLFPDDPAPSHSLVGGQRPDVTPFGGNRASVSETYAAYPSQAARFATYERHPNPSWTAASEQQHSAQPSASSHQLSAAELERRHEHPLAFPPNHPVSNAFSPHRPGLNAFPPHRPGSNAFPPHSPGSNAFPPHRPGSNAFPPHSPGSNAFPPHRPGSNPPVAQHSQYAVLNEKKVIHYQPVYNINIDTIKGKTHFGPAISGNGQCADSREQSAALTSSDGPQAAQIEGMENASQDRFDSGQGRLEYGQNRDVEYRQNRGEHEGGGQLPFGIQQFSPDVETTRIPVFAAGTVQTPHGEETIAKSTVGLHELDDLTPMPPPLSRRDLASQHPLLSRYDLATLQPQLSRDDLAPLQPPLSRDDLAPLHPPLNRVEGAGELNRPIPVQLDALEGVRGLSELSGENQNTPSVPAVAEELTYGQFPTQELPAGIQEMAGANQNSAALSHPETSEGTPGLYSTQDLPAGFQEATGSNPNTTAGHTENERSTGAVCETGDPVPVGVQQSTSESESLAASSAGSWQFNP